MDTEEQKQYHALCRGAATYILLGNNNDLGMTVEEIATLYAVSLTTAREDIDKIVQAERHKVGGVFEAAQQ